MTTYNPLAVAPNEMTGALISKASSQSAPANPSGTTSTTYVMMGLAVPFVPLVTGRVRIWVGGNAANGTASDGLLLNIAVGTGTAPSNGDALTGTVISTPMAVTNNASTAAVVFPFATRAITTGHALGVAIWIDLQLKAVTGGTATLTNLSVVMEEY